VKEAIFHPEARAEMRESFEFYEARLDGAVEQATERIVVHREAGTPLAGEFRKRIVQGFPFNIIYRVWEDYIYLVAVAHQHRRPGYWRERADRRKSGGRR